ncbi:MAG: hypothetical protein H6818_17240 [Phycisphaerales bacterium]|nr:hypothetical protein [Phycisphaerales bacterium]
MAAAEIDRAYLPWSPSCNEYFKGFSTGRFDKDSQLWYILPIQKVSLDHSRGAFVVGHAGCDGIEFCFRISDPGVWAYYPIEERWELLAPSLAELERGWLSGAITV